MTQHTTSDELREELHRILLKNGVEGKQYNRIWSEVIALIKKRELDAKINTIEQLIPNPVAEMASIDFEHELKRQFDYLRKYLAELKAEREGL